jgi:hypothetical protein
MRFARRHPPHHLSPTQANDPAGQGWTQERASAASRPHSNAQFAAECQSILSKMIVLSLASLPEAPCAHYVHSSRRKEDKSCVGVEPILATPKVECFTATFHN